VSGPGSRSAGGATAARPRAARTALWASTYPAPTTRSGNGIGLAVARNRVTTSSGLSRGLASSSRATTPLTWGAAKLVPLAE
jgi:hypothetical protein